MSNQDSQDELEELLTKYGDDCIDNKAVYTYTLKEVVDAINAHTQKAVTEAELHGKLEVWKYLQKEFENSDGYFEIDVSKVHSFIELIEMQLTMEGADNEW